MFTITQKKLFEKKSLSTEQKSTCFAPPLKVPHKTISKSLKHADDHDYDHSSDDGRGDDSGDDKNKTKHDDDDRKLNDRVADSCVMILVLAPK